MKSGKRRIKEKTEHEEGNKETSVPFQLSLCL
jgi:hypothetical protein